MPASPDACVCGCGVVSAAKPDVPAEWAAAAAVAEEKHARDKAAQQKRLKRERRARRAAAARGDPTIRPRYRIRCVAAR